MKKALSTILAITMIFSMASVSFAKKINMITEGFSTGGIIGVRMEDDSSNAEVYTVRKSEIDEQFNQDYYPTTARPAEYGSVAYIVLENNDDFILDMMRNIKVKTEWEEGKDLVKSVEVILLGVDTVVGRRYAPAIKISLNDSTATAEADIIGTITLNKKKGDQEYRIKDAEIPVAFSVSHAYNYVEFDVLEIKDDQQIFYSGDSHLLKFNCDEEVELTFGREPNEGTFTVDVSGQGKVLLKFDSDANEAIEKANPNANLLFFGFNNVKFNRTGEFFYETETGKYIYEIVNGVPVAISTEYDEADEGFRFNTNVLGRYVISDIELVAPTAENAA